MAVAQWVRCWNSNHRVVQREGLGPRGDVYQIFFSNDFISVLCWAEWTSVIQQYCVVGQIVVANDKCFDKPL